MVAKLITDDLTDFEAPLIYWAKTVSGGLKGFFSGKKNKAPINEDYFLFEFINTVRRARSSAGYDTITGFWNNSYPAEYIVRLTIYGNASKTRLVQIENSLFGEEVPRYLASHGLCFAKVSNIKHSEPFEYTEFLPQSQMDLTFNVTLSSYEDKGFIEQADADIEEQ